MFRQLFRRAWILALVPVLVLSAQDAGLVLRTSVTYRTQRNTLQLTDAQRKQADDLARQAQAATQAQNYGEALRSYYQGLAVMRGLEWTPAFALASSLEGGLDHAMVEPGKTVKVLLKAIYTSPRAAEVKMTASLNLLPGGQSLGPQLPVDAAALPFSTSITLPDVTPGDYTVEVRLTTTTGATAGNPFVKSLPVHVEALSAEASRLRDRLAHLAQKNSTTTTAEYALALYALADQGNANPSRYKWRDEFTAAATLLDAAEKGRDPFAARHGDVRKAYRSAVDNTLQPYRVFVPQTYSGSQPAPLLVALHGMGGDENSMFDTYSGTLKREAERVGFVVAAPKGRDTASMYRGSAEQDVLDVIAEVRRDYKIDPNRIYLMGHSMGGYGTWSVALAHPDLFAALGPISGGGDPTALPRIRQIPVYVVHGDDDRTVNVSESRRMVEAGKKAGMEIVYVEVPGGSHVSVAAPQFGPMLDFFAKQSRHAVSGSEVATADNLAGRYTGEWKGSSAGTFRLSLDSAAGGSWKCEATFTLSGEEIKTIMRQCKVDQSQIEAAYDFDTQGLTLHSQITGHRSAKGFEGTYRTTTTDGSADVDQGTWNAARVQ